ncbi:MAG: Beta-galactosidase trimerization domain, partial [Miltoncostaeaceae bacterium]|nr:Beta-galactosidase trimerization domain [Miltoncostaeaceae bacterium]
PAGPAAAADPSAAPGRPAGHVFDWSHELNEEELPNWNPRRIPIPPARWYRIIDGILRTAGESGLWFSGFGALPFDIPLHPHEPTAWRTPANFLAQYRRTGLRWDLNLEARAAKNALRLRWATVSNPDAIAPTRRLSLLDPGYRRAALAEIRRLVPRYRGQPFVYALTGSDEPIAVLPCGRARRSPFGRRLARDLRARYGQPLPDPTARPTAAVAARLSWLAYSRYASDRFFAMKEEQAALIRRLDPGALVSPNDYGFIDGFLPWDYTRLAAFADLVEADPYVSYAERATPGRGRYNPGFAAKLLSDLTGKPVRIVVQAFPYAGYRPRPRDLGVWAGQALRAGATDISFFAMGNPRFTDRPLYDRMLAIARELRGATLPAPPVDPGTVVVYATASEGQAQPQRPGDARYRTAGDALYTTYSLLGEMAHGAFSFDADTRLLGEPERLARARTVWLPRGEVLDRPFADALLGWVNGGGTLVVTDPAAFTRTPDGSPLSDVRDALIGAPLGGPRTGDVLLAPPGTLGPALPADLLTIPLEGRVRRAFAAIPAGATVVARFIDDAPAVLLRQVGAGRVLAFASDPMEPAVLDSPLDLVRLVAAVQTSQGARLDDPAWSYTIPGIPTGPPWDGADEGDGPITAPAPP